MVDIGFLALLKISINMFIVSPSLPPLHYQGDALVRRPLSLFLIMEPQLLELYQ